MVNGVYTLGQCGYTVALAFLLAGACSNSWLVDSDDEQTRRGIFWLCESDGRCYPLQTTKVETCVQAFILAGIGFGASALLLSAMFLMKMTKPPLILRKYPSFSLVLSSLAGLLTFTGVLLYRVKYYSIDNLGIDVYEEYYIGYSFSLVIVGSICLVFAGLLVYAGANRVTGSRPNRTSGPSVFLSQTSRNIEWSSTYRATQSGTGAHITLQLGQGDETSDQPPSYETSVQNSRQSQIIHEGESPPSYNEVVSQLLNIQVSLNNASSK